MPQSVSCPECAKVFRLAEDPPETFRCTGCGAWMDLSGFGGTDAPGTPPSGGGRRSTGQDPAGRRGTPGRRAAGSGRRGAEQKTGKGAPVIPIVALILGVLVLIIARSTGDDGASSSSEEPLELPAPGEVGRVGDIVPPPNGEPTAPTTQRKPRRDWRNTPERKIKRLELRELPWPEEVDPTTRDRVERAIVDIYRGGREGVEGREYLIKQGRPICGRLISEFAAIQKHPGFDNREGTSRAAAIDFTLRQIDGYIERRWNEREKIRAWGIYAGPRFVRTIAQRWTWWWLEGEWKSTPRKPWQADEDESDEAADGIKRPDKKEGSKKGSGYGKRAGSD